MEPEGSLPRLHVPATCPYPQPAQSSPCSPHPTSWRFVLMLSSHLGLQLPFYAAWNPSIAQIRSISRRKPVITQTGNCFLPDEADLLLFLASWWTMGSNQPTIQWIVTASSTGEKDSHSARLITNIFLVLTSSNGVLTPLPYLFSCRRVQSKTKIFTALILPSSLRLGKARNYFPAQSLKKIVCLFMVSPCMLYISPITSFCISPW